MKTSIELPYELDWVMEELRVALERSLAEIAGGARPDYAAGYFACAKELTEALEASYARQLEARRGIRAVKQDG